MYTLYHFHILLKELESFVPSSPQRSFPCSFPCSFPLFVPLFVPLSTLLGSLILRQLRIAHLCLKALSASSIFFNQRLFRSSNSSRSRIRLCSTLASLWLCCWFDVATTTCLLVYIAAWFLPRHSAPRPLRLDWEIGVFLFKSPECLFQVLLCRAVDWLSLENVPFLQLHVFWNQGLFG